MSEIASLISEAKSGLLIVGALTDDSDVQAVKQLSAKLQWPVFADIRSGLRLGSDKEHVIDYFDQILLSNKIDQSEPDIVLHFGNVMTSKRFNKYVSECGCSHYIQVANHPLRRDPAGVVTERVQTNIADFCAGLSVTPQKQERVAFTKGLIEANSVAGEMIDKFIDERPDLTEITLARLISEHIAKDTALFLGSSMPVRDMDMYADHSGNPVRVIANRGVSGIDGSIATAVGYAGGLGKPVTAVIGDLAFLHDVNSLALLRNSQQPVYLIVINNNGGGIFSLLPIHECKDVFEEYFGTPHGLACEKFADGFDLNYRKPENTADFVEKYQQAQRDGKACIIEVVTDREVNRTVHLDLQKRIRAALSSESVR